MAAGGSSAGGWLMAGAGYQLAADQYCNIENNESLWLFI